MYKKKYCFPLLYCCCCFSLHLASPAVTLVRKLIVVLESCEKLPVLTYESLGGGSGLQVKKKLFIE